MKKAVLFILFFYAVLEICIGQQNVITPSFLLKRIAAQQIENDPYFLKGLFPSYISHNQKFNRKKGNNNIFYNGLIGYTFNYLKPFLTRKEQLIADSITNKSIPVFNYFKNRKGRETYNFWRTDSAFVFPYGAWINKINRDPEVPDDLDATVISMAALNVSDSIAQKVHQVQQEYTNKNPSQLRVDNPIYKNFPTYSTWYGKSFPVVFDVCVLANVLSFVQLNHLKWTTADSAAIQLIVAVVANKDHINHPLQVAPYYGKTSIILYHLARLMVIKKILALESTKSQLIKDANERLQATNNILEKILLSTALIKWGENPPTLLLPNENEIENSIEKNDFPFFVGNIPSYLPKTIRHIMIHLKMGVFYHYCPAYNDALLLEYLVLKNHV